MRHLLCLLASTALGAGIAAGCSSSSPSASSPDASPSSSSPPPKTSPPASKVIGKSGGTLALDDGTASVDIPAGALSKDTTIAIKLNSAAPAPSGVKEVGSPYTFTPDGLKFMKPVTVTLPFDEQKIPKGATSADLVVFTAPDGQKKYTPLPSALKGSSHISATTQHFSTDVVVFAAADASTGGDDASTGEDDGSSASDAGEEDASAETDADVDASSALDAGFNPPPPPPPPPPPDAGEDAPAIMDATLFDVVVTPDAGAPDEGIPDEGIPDAFAVPDVQLPR